MKPWRLAGPKPFWRSTWWLAAGWAVCISAWATPTASSPSANPIARGQDKADTERCTQCHGVGNESAHPVARIETPPPALQGQTRAYMLKQLQDFRSGARAHDFMAMMARSLDELDAADITAYYASLPRAQPPALVGDPAPKLFSEGDPERSIAACASCHGAQGQGDGQLIPRLAGQEPRYLQAQLRAWRQGERRNSPGGSMSLATKRLTDAEIDQLSAWLAAH